MFDIMEAGLTKLSDRVQCLTLHTAPPTLLPPPPPFCKMAA